MRQYEMYFTNEYTEEIVEDLTGLMEIEYDSKQLMDAMKEADTSSANNLYIGANDKNKIIVDCNNRDWIYSLIVICEDTYGNLINQKMLEWDNRIREEYAQEPTEEISDVYGKSQTLLSSIELAYGILLS